MTALVRDDGNGNGNGAGRTLTVRTQLIQVILLTALVPVAVFVAVLAVLAMRDVLSFGAVIWLTALLLGLAGAAVAAVVGLLERAVVDPIRRSLDEADASQRAFRGSIDRIGALLGATHDRTSIISVLLETAAVTVDARTAVFWQLSGAELTPEATYGQAPPATAMPRREGLAGHAAATDRQVRHPPTPLHEGEPAVDAAMAVPLHGRGRTFGVVALYGRERPAPFTNDDTTSVSALVRQAEAAIANIFLHEEAKSLSITDGLTGLWNRRQLDFSCANEIERAARFNETFAVIMVDIDHFKPINDEHGHLAGDAVLVELAGRLTDVTREVDVVARYGGEEFVLLLPRTDPEGARLVAEKLADVVRSQPFSIDECDLRLTISVGVATYPQDGTTSRALLKAVDEALYAAKHAGRDQVVTASPTEEDP